MNPATYESLILPSGFRLAVSTLPQSECASFSIHVPAGSRDDLPGLAGTAHFVEHMVFKGTPRRDARAISLDIEDAGGSLNACTTEDQVVYEARGDADSLSLLADITADIVWNASFPTKEIGLERDVIAEEIVMEQRGGRMKPEGPRGSHRLHRARIGRPREKRPEGRRAPARQTPRRQPDEDGHGEHRLARILGRRQPASIRAHRDTGRSTGHLASRHRGRNPRRGGRDARRSPRHGGDPALRLLHRQRPADESENGHRGSWLL